MFRLSLSKPPIAGVTEALLYQGTEEPAIFLATKNQLHELTRGGDMNLLARVGM